MRMFFALWIMPPDERADVLKQYAEEISAEKEREKESNPPKPAPPKPFLYC